MVILNAKLFFAVCRALAFGVCCNSYMVAIQALKFFLPSSNIFTVLMLEQTEEDGKNISITGALKWKCSPTRHFILSPREHWKENKKHYFSRQNVKTVFLCVLFLTHFQHMYTCACVLVNRTAACQMHFQTKHTPRVAYIISNSSVSIQNCSILCVFNGNMAVNGSFCTEHSVPSWGVSWCETKDRRLFLVWGCLFMCTHITVSRVGWVGAGALRRRGDSVTRGEASVAPNAVKQ